MILSVSRRTDIPNYYSDWFLNRIKEGFLYVRNPMNPHQLSRIPITPQLVDCIVFWTKNPGPMMERLEELKDYAYYFQFTLTPYGRDIEPNLPDKRTRLIPTFQELSGRIGRERVIWRYDPILITDRCTVSYHCEAFQEIAERLRGYTDRVVVSFVDMYAKTKRNMGICLPKSLTEEEMRALAAKLAAVATANHMEIESCAETIDLSEVGISHGSCIDRRRIEALLGCRLEGTKDKNQRPECGCMESVEVGAYHTCGNGCRYCYANFSDEKVAANKRLCDPASPLQCGQIGDGDIITERKVRSLKKTQMSLFD